MISKKEIKLKYKPDFIIAQEYWDAFWDHEIIDRPCVVLTAKGDNPRGSIPRFISPNSDFSVMMQEYDEYLSSHCFFYLDGPDAIPYLDDILSIDAIDAVQWVPGSGTKPQHEWSEVLHKIQSSGKAVIIIDR